MTGSRILYFYLVALSFIFFVLFDHYLFHLFFIFVLLLPPVSLLAALPVRRALRCRMEAEDDIVPKGGCTLCLTAENASLFPCARVRVKLSRANALGRVDGAYAEILEETVQFSLPARSTFTLRPEFDMAACGRVDFTVRRIGVCDMLGLFFLPLPKRNRPQSSASVYVLPALQSRSIRVEDAADLGMDSATYSTEKAGGDPSEIHELRDYRPGDARHSIHWKLSSRMNRLIVREFGLPLNPSLHFLIELREGAGLNEAEYMLGTALAFSEYLMAREITHSVSWLGEEGMLHTVPVSGADTLASALNALLALPAVKPWRTLARFAVEAPPRSDTHLVCLIAGAHSEDAENPAAERLLASLLELGVCRRVTLMPDRCTGKTAERYLSLGCEVQLMNGRLPGAETEEAL